MEAFNENRGSAEHAENAVRMDTFNCTKCNRNTPLCSNCHFNILNQVDIGVCNEEPNEIADADKTIHSSFEFLEDYESTEELEATPLYDAELSMIENSMDRCGRITYGRGAEAVKERKILSKVVRALNFLDDLDGLDLAEGQSESQILDTRNTKSHDPNLINSIESQTFAQTSLQTVDYTFNYSLPKETLNKIQSVLESNNFTNFYTLIGELKHILSPSEIEEIVANKEYLAAYLNPDVMAAFSMSPNVNEFSSPFVHLDYDHNSNNNTLNENNDYSFKSFDIISTSILMERQDLPTLIAKEDDRMNNCFSSATSISNGYNSKESSLTDESIQNELNDLQQNKHKKSVPLKDKYGSDEEEKQHGQEISSSNGSSPNDNGTFQCFTNITNSFRKKPVHGENVTAGNVPQKYVEDENFGLTRPPIKPQQDSSTGKSLNVENGVDSRQGSENGKEETPKMFLVRDSTRFNKESSSRVIQGLFVECKSTNGTLKRIKVPLNIADDDDVDDTGVEERFYSTSDDTVTDNNNHDLSAVKNPRSHKKRISVDDHILSIASEMDPEVTQSDIFYSMTNSSSDEDRTIRSDNGYDEDITLDLDTPDDDTDESKLEQLESIDRERIPELTAAEELEDERCWKSFRVGANDFQIDLKAIQPYRRVLSHGGYADAERKVAIILFSGCFLPDRSRKEYSYLLDHLFLYVLASLEELVAENYVLVYLHGATPTSCRPTFGWLKRCYQLINRRLRKNLKGLYLVHPTFWLKAVLAFSKPFTSSKFIRKIHFVNTLSDLRFEIPTEHLMIPDKVLQYDAKLQAKKMQKKN